MRKLPRFFGEVFMRVFWASILTVFILPGIVAAVPRQKPEEKAKSPYALLRVTLAKSDDTAAYRRSLIAILKMKCFFDALLLKQEVAGLKSVRGQENPAAWVERNLRVAYLENGNLKVFFGGGNCAEQIVIVNAVVKDYLDYVKQKTVKARKIRPARIKDFEKSLSMQRRYLKEAEAKIATYQARLAQNKDPKLVIDYNELIGGGQKAAKRAKEGIKRFQAAIEKVKKESDDPPVTLLKKAKLPK
jgi:hypothetical protein